MLFTADRIANTRLAAIAGIVLVLVGVAGGMVLDNRTSPPPYAMPVRDCLQSPETVEPSVPWRFRKDPADVGERERWFDPALDDSHWQNTPPGEPWESEYIGVAWYRVTFAPPSDWSTAYLGVAGVDDTAQLWMNGVKLDWNPTSGGASQILRLTAGQPSQLSFRIVNLGGPGGIKEPVRVGRDPWSALRPTSYARWLAATHPDWPMPGWARDGFSAWTFTGLPGQEYKALFGADGAVAPWPDAPSVGLWIYDSAAAKLTAPQPRFSLMDDALPIPRNEWAAGGSTIGTTLYRSADGRATHWQVTLKAEANQPIENRLLVVVYPFAFNPHWRPTAAVGFDGQRRLWVDGQPFMRASSKPDQSGVGTLVEILGAAQLGRVPQAQNLPCSRTGEAAAAAAFNIHLLPGEERTLTFHFPSQAGLPFPDHRAHETVDDTRRLWQAALGKPGIVIPDQAIVNGYQASLGYLLLALTPDGPRPGPLEHAKLWVRDAAFVGEALLGAGRSRLVSEYLPLLFKHQAADGYVPAIIGKAGPEPTQEWDAQGEVIFLVAETYRYQRDIALLQRWEPNVRRAAEHLRALRAQTRANPPATRGLLPPSASAEDLGSDKWHHYWDDYWAVIGMEEAAFIEGELGHMTEAAWMRAEADELRAAIRSSVEAVMGPNPAFLPGAPEDLTSSAMARGNSVSLYPIEVFPVSDPLVRRSFETYYSRWIAPNSGGYRHVWGQLWPYGGLGLARDYLRLGRQDIVHQILGWTLSHQTLPGTYAWAEQVSPSHGGITGGDMPHAWAAATYVTLIREMLVLRHDDRLELFAGTPPSWLEKGKLVGVRDAPTEFGTLTALVESDLDMRSPNWTGTLTLTISGSAQPPGGFRWKLPREPSTVEGPGGTQARDGWLEVPAAGGRVRIRYQAQ